jgi:hypothetical protein
MMSLSSKRAFLREYYGKQEIHLVVENVKIVPA